MLFPWRTWQMKQFCCWREGQTASCRNPVTTFACPCFHTLICFFENASRHIQTHQGASYFHLCWSCQLVKFWMRRRHPLASPNLLLAFHLAYHLASGDVSLPFNMFLKAKRLSTTQPHSPPSPCWSLQTAPFFVLLSPMTVLIFHLPF